MPTTLVDRKQTSLTAAFGSSNSLHSTSHSHLVGLNTHKPLDTIPHRGSDSESLPDSESGSQEFKSTSPEHGGGGGVQFQLGGERQVIL